MIKTEDFCKRLLGRRIDKLYMGEMAAATHPVELEHTAQGALKTQHKKPSRRHLTDEDR